MPEPDRKQLAKGLLASLGFIAAGVFMRWAEAPAPIVWLPIVFGTLGVTLIGYRFFKPMADLETPGGDDGSGVVLRAGRDYRLNVTASEFELRHKTSGEVRRMAWSAVALVLVLAIDNFPVGGISFMIHDNAGGAIEAPWDCENNGAFLHAMQEKLLPGFDNAAVIEGSSMLHGLKQVWPPAVDAARDAVTPPG